MEEDRIAKTFKDKTVFITGGSGFLGLVLIEKILRCTEVKRIYLLLRSKNGKSPQDRILELFNNLLFGELKKAKPQSIEKCFVISGDVSEVDLGISRENRRTLQREVDFIFHSAASTRFDESLRVAVKINARGTKYMLDLAKQCLKLKFFLHVSTAFAYPFEEICYEKAYKPPVNPHEILKKLEIDKTQDEDDFEQLIGNYPNTYIFSKALAESLVVEEFHNVPAVIIRPSIVCSILKDPLPGWCKNLQGPMGLLVGAGKGIVRSVYIKKDSIADFIPVDIVINGFMIAAWQSTELKLDHKFGNFVSSNDVPLTWEQVIEIGKDVIFNETPFNTIAWYPGGSLESSKIKHTINFYLFQLIPAIFLDMILFLFGYKPFLFQIQKRIRAGTQVFEYFTYKHWAFDCANIHELREKLNETEKEIYKVDSNGIDTREYLKQCVLFVRRNIFKETDEMLPKARLYMKIMYVVDIVWKSILMLAFAYYAWTWILVPIFSKS